MPTELTAPEGEALLPGQGMALSEALAADTWDLPAIDARAEALCATATRLAAQYRHAALHGDNAKLAEWLANRDQPPLRATADLTPVTYSAATADVLQAHWREQVRAFGAAAQDLIASGQPGHAGQSLWMYWQDSQDGRKEGLPFFRAEALRNGLNDLIKLQQLLQNPPPFTAVAPGEVLFEDSFETVAANWRTFGDGKVTAADGQLTIQGEACTLWLEQDFENVVIDFDYTPVTLAPKAGALFAFPATPAPGHAWADSAGPMERYNRMIDTYHASLCRGGTGMTNLRRTGPGLRLLSSVQPDPCATLGKTYHVEILSTHGCLYVLVDGALQHAYVDRGVHGTILKRGQFGLRLFAGGKMEMRLAKFRVRAVTLP